MIIMFGADKYTICNKNRTIQLNDFKIYACWKACHFRPISFNLYGSLQDVFILIDVFVDKIVSLSDVTLPFFCESKNVKLNKMDDLKMNRKKNGGDIQFVNFLGDCEFSNTGRLSPA